MGVNWYRNTNTNTDTRVTHTLLVKLKRYSRLSAKFFDFGYRKNLLFDKVLSDGYETDNVNHIYIYNQLNLS